MISVVILTKNEERDIAACIQSVKWSNDIHILDSGSSDKTVDIAIQLGANVAFHLFETFGIQRNYALDHLNIRNEWILFLDADEIVTEKFRLSIAEAIEKADKEVAGFYCCWKMILEGRWLKHCDNFPKWQFRLMRKGRARFTDFGHGQKEDKVCGEILYIKEPYLHFGFSKGWNQWIERHNKYSSEEATQRLRKCPPFNNIFSRHSSRRNPALKSWLSRLPGWPILRFFHAYFINLGFLEGAQGFIYCTNMSYYEFLIQIKMREIRNGSSSKYNEYK
jgi:glycosyltransferase involved in cell wall biosynthesis